jgi:LuxR family maltose regulon positive regulatory protein
MWLATLAERGFRVAWVSLDGHDNDPVCFWSYILTALNQAARGSGEQALALLASPQSPLMETVLTALINALATASDDLVLALDEYQVIETPAIHDTVAFLLQHAPSCLHLALASRSEPPFALPRLRALGQSLELHTDDLRLNQEEAAEFLTQTMQLDLAPLDIVHLHLRTEGWLAGLQLAALSLQGRQDRQYFIASLSGGQAAIREYPMEEVLLQQPEAVQLFLLQTSILERLSGQLCDAITEQQGGQALLLRLEQANLFVLSLDEQRQWYRYYPLFAEALRAHLQLTQPHLLPLLHQRAASWYEAQGYTAEAIEHLLAIPDYKRAAQSIEQQAQPMLTAGQLSTLLRWLKALPDNEVQARLALSLYFAWTLLFTGQFHAAQARLRKVMASSRPLLYSTADALQYQHLLEETDALRRMLNAFHAPTFLQQERDPAPEDQWDGTHFWRSLVALSLGFEAVDAGAENTASSWFQEALRSSTGQGDLLVPVLALCQLAEIALVQGHLHHAAAWYRQALRLACDSAGHALPIAGLAYQGLGLLLREWNDLEAAVQHLRTSIELCTQWAEAWALDSYLTLARVYAAKSDHNAALGATQQAERIAEILESEVFSEHVAMTRVRIALLQGQVEAPVRWACTARVGLESDICAEDESKYLLLARVLLAQGKLNEALLLVGRLLPAVETAGRNGRVIELLALQALALSAQNENNRAMGVLEQALTLAAPGGYVRLFVEWGQPMVTLLQRAHARQILPDYTDILLAAFGTASAHNGKVKSTSFRDLLTPREQEVLCLLANGASNRAMAEELVVTVGTVKKHLFNIFRKLQVESRTQAIAAASKFTLV